MRKVQQLQADTVQFLGEQDGPPEGVLKGRLTRLFEAERVKCCAYLSRVSYGSNHGTNVALCLRIAPGSEQLLVQKIGEVFASIFRGREHLDIVFLSGDQEKELSSRCPAFFSDPEV